LANLVTHTLNISAVFVNTSKQRRTLCWAISLVNHPQIQRECEVEHSTTLLDHRLLAAYNESQKGGKGFLPFIWFASHARGH